MLVDGQFEADGYKLRMSLGKWWLWLFLNGVDTGKEVGPFIFSEALIYAKSYRLVDVERV
jgi:hypothetical protein